MAVEVCLVRVLVSGDTQKREKGQNQEGYRLLSKRKEMGRRVPHIHILIGMRPVVRLLR